MQTFLFLVAFIANRVSSVSFCRKRNLNPAQRIICQNILNWQSASKNVAVALGRPGRPPNIGSGNSFQKLDRHPPIPETLYDCLDIQCICSFIQGAVYVHPVCRLPDGSIYSKARRKEYRLLSDNERELRVFKVFSIYRQGFLAVRYGTYDELSVFHANSTLSPGAHSGPAFLPWHREFLKRLEIGIRTTAVNGAYPFVNVAIPYWDSTMDNDILQTFTNSSSKWSVMFSEELMGSVQDGYLDDGEFSGFQGRLGKVTRMLDGYPEFLTLMTRKQVATAILTKDVNEVLAATAGELLDCPTVSDTAVELIHSYPHTWVGGDMLLVPTSTNDPIFFLHHAFIDYIFEQWRQRGQTRYQRETQWNTGPTGCYTQSHRIDAVMAPFTALVNEDGLSNAYTDNLYSYQPRDDCSNRKSCKSRFLFCNLGTGRCVAKIKIYAPCRVIRGVDPCFDSVCSNKVGSPGQCVEGRPPKPFKPKAEPKKKKFKPCPAPDKQKHEKCFNRDPCCNFKANRWTCIQPNIKTACPVSCGVCIPFTYNFKSECSNRHKLCASFMQQGFCATYRSWMAENCRRECHLCHTPKKKTCDFGFRRHPHM